MIVMLIASGLKERFREHLGWATEVDLISAWATEHCALTLLEEHHKHKKCKLRIRAIVGLWHNITDPEALRRIALIGELRLVGDGRHFHPKIYLFRNQQRSVAWVGSANFTEGGFTLNEEAVLESDDTDSVDTWFTNLWENIGPLGDRSIEAYASCREKDPPPKQLLDWVTGETVEPKTLLNQLNDWGSYFAAIKRCDMFWRKDHPFSVLGEQNSWSCTIKDLHKLITRTNWVNFNDCEKRRVFGRDPKYPPLLGPIPTSSLNTVFGKNVKAIQRILHEVADLDDSDFPDRAIDAYMKMHGFEGISTGIATRLLSLARPDRFVLVNNYSQARLALYSDLSPTTLRSESNYLKLLEFIYEQPWFQSGKPSDSFEASIWDMRVALLDCFFVYPRKQK